MADRKQFQNVPAVDQELAHLLNESRNRPVTEDELREQRVSFAFGNAPAASDRITKASVRAASTHIRMFNADAEGKLMDRATILQALAPFRCDSQPCTQLECWRIMRRLTIGDVLALSALYASVADSGGCDIDSSG